jgi:trehalose 6-phosphate phosphatase
MASTAGHNAVEDFTALDLGSVALLLDVDGTLIDIGPSPFEVDVPASLCQSLERLLELTGGALALVSGRPIRDIDKLFAPLKLPAIGGHGAELRARGLEITSRAKPLPDKFRKQLTQAAGAAAGVVVEDKGYSVALHYRKAPQQERRLRALAQAALADLPGEAIEVLPGKAMFEIKRTGLNKGEAVHALMSQAPFAGRTPVFVGDDVTDETVFAVLPALAGKGYSVSLPYPGLAGIFATPEAVRETLRRLASH